MELEIAALAASAGTSIVTMVATDAWQTARDGLAALWRRVRPERAEAVVTALDATRDELLQARSAGDDEASATRTELAAEWQGRVRRLLAGNPEVADDLRALLAELAPQTPATAPGVTQSATASGSARIYQAGRDLRLNEQ
ncbi:hypothetical protein ABZ721_32875 [Streptomyces sp. NPDC006733]|uniref:hypothetical protein n=1 Tax=Streptomyces sp. NPDC006733 TaxID=3155460 RepID=UPI0033E20B43